MKSTSSQQVTDRPDPTGKSLSVQEPRKRDDRSDLTTGSTDDERKKRAELAALAADK